MSLFFREAQNALRSDYFGLRRPPKNVSLGLFAEREMGLGWVWFVAGGWSGAGGVLWGCKRVSGFYVGENVQLPATHIVRQRELSALIRTPSWGNSSWSS